MALKGNGQTAADAAQLTLAIEHVTNLLCSALDGVSGQKVVLPDSISHPSAQKLALLVNVMLQTVRDQVKAAEAAAAEASRQREIAEKMAQSREQFLAVLGHELRTPLTAIVGTIGRLSRTRLDADQSALVETVTGASRMLTGLTDDLLDLAHLDAGLIRVRAAPTDLRSLVTSTIASVRAGIGKAVPVDIEIAPDISSFIECDGLRVAQMLSNLLSNALKFSGPGAVQLTIDARDHAYDPLAQTWAQTCRMIIGEDAPEPPDGWLRLAVEDGGTGLRAEQVAKLGERYNTSGSPAGQGMVGTGIGLSLTAQLAGFMGGRLSVASRPGHGSVFAIDIPYRPTAALAAIAPTGAGAQTQGRILVVDDDNGVRQVAGALLEEAGYEVVVTDAPEAALTAMARQAFDLVLVDLHLGAASGWPLIRQGDHLTGSITRFVPMTAGSRNALPSGSGGTAVIAKPFDRTALLQTVANYLGLPRASRHFAETVWNTNFGGLAPGVKAQLLDSVRADLLKFSVALDALEPDNAASAAHRLATSLHMVGYPAVAPAFHAFAGGAEAGPSMTGDEAVLHLRIQARALLTHLAIRMEAGSPVRPD